VVSKQNVTDIGCSSWDWNKQICLQCAKGWYQNSDKKCTRVSDLCKEVSNNGECTSCYTGYDLNKGICQISISNCANPSDQGCKKWNG
jgi:hypothetical protein